MKKGTILFFKAVIISLGVGVLTFMLWEPHLEGRNVGATLFEIYFNDPFLACAYIASIPFFIALYQAFLLLGYIGENKTFSLSSVRSARIIKYCALCLIAFGLVGEAYLFIVQRGREDDIAGGVALGLFMIVSFIAVAIVARVFERVLQNGVDIKSKN
jgi:hypothetical protein